jgi:hypothetical protein
MKGPELKRLYKKYLQATLNDFQFKGRLLFRFPTRHCLAGVVFDASGWSADGFYLKAFAQPLYVPADYEILSYGCELRTRDLRQFWTMDSASESAVMAEVLGQIVEQGVPVLSQRQSPSDFLDNAHGYGPRCNPYTIEIVAYSLLLIGDHNGARSELAKVNNKLNEMIRDNPEIAWLRAILDRCIFIQGKLDDGGDSAVAQLLAWEEYTVNSLKLLKEWQAIYG